MLTAVVTLAGDSLVSVRLQSTPTDPPTTEATAADEAHAEDGVTAVDGTNDETHATEELDEGPSPIMPEVKELLWGFGAFIVLCLAMRYAIYPRLREGMKRRYDSIQDGYTDADALRMSAEGEVAAYQTALAGVKSEAVAVVESARQVLEGERQARLSEVNAGIAERKAAAAADAAAARQAAETHVNEAAGSVASRIVELVTGNQPPDDAVRTAVDAASGAVVR